MAEHPGTPGPDTSLGGLLERIVGHARTGHVYVVEENKLLLGSVRV